MTEIVQLSQHDVLIERPFTNPDHIAADRAILQTIAHYVWQQHHELVAAGPTQQSFLCYYPTAQCWQKRLLLIHPEQLTPGQTLTMVGFLGQRRFEATPEIAARIMAMDEQLLLALGEAPGMVGYCSFLLVDGLNYANLVLMNSALTIDQWRQNELHQQINRFDSPQFYANVRIYSGLLTCHSPQLGPQVELQRVKYWDYQSTPTWHAVRLLSTI
ncbi:MAG: hypothetical protein R3C14_20210 [Caldilineaceae bacterium]